MRLCEAVGGRVAETVQCSAGQPGAVWDDLGQCEANVGSKAQCCAVWRSLRPCGPVWGRVGQRGVK